MGFEKKTFLVCDRCGFAVEVAESDCMFDVADKQLNAGRKPVRRSTSSHFEDLNGSFAMEAGFSIAITPPVIKKPPYDGRLAGARI